jgi:pimeloyl-ACP methyl ester carboxylesterase
MARMERGMVVIPGGTSNSHHPLLDRTWQAGLARGAEAVHVEWPADRPKSRDPADSADMVVAHVVAAMAVLAVERPVLVGKSLGTYAAEVAADRALPAIWHTPLLTDPRCVAAAVGDFIDECLWTVRTRRGGRV